MRLLYIANIRIPSEKAHTYQIMRMCSAFAASGAEVTLLVPDRKSQIAGDPFAFYGIPKNFKIERLSVKDTIGVKYLPGYLALAIALFSFHGAVKKYVKDFKKTTNARFDAWYTREALLLPFLQQGKDARHALVYEAHDFPKRWRWYFRLCLRFPRLVIATSEALRSALLTQGALSSRIMVERNGVDVEFFSHADGSALRKSQGIIREDERVALYTGSLQEWKGVGTLLEAFDLLKISDKEIQLWIVGGTAADVANWKKRFPTRSGLSHERIGIVFFGLVPHARIAEFMAAADVCVLPNSALTKESASFTSPIKLYEYLASGCPIVASDLPSIREIVDETTVKFVPPDDPRALAEGILEALKNPGEARARATTGRYMVVARYGWDARGARILARLGAA